MGRISRKGFTAYELVVTIFILTFFVLFVGVCGSLIYFLISAAA